MDTIGNKAWSWYCEAGSLVFEMSSPAELGHLGWALLAMSRAWALNGSAPQGTTLFVSLLALASALGCCSYSHLVCWPHFSVGVAAYQKWQNCARRSGESCHTSRPSTQPQRLCNALDRPLCTSSCFELGRVHSAARSAVAITHSPRLARRFVASPAGGRGVHEGLGMVNWNAPA